MTETPETRGYDSVIVAVAHEAFLHENIVEGYAKENAVVFDAKGILPRNAGALRL